MNANTGSVKASANSPDSRACGQTDTTGTPMVLGEWILFNPLVKAQRGTPAAKSLPTARLRAQAGEGGYLRPALIVMGFTAWFQMAPSRALTQRPSTSRARIVGPYSRAV